MYNKDFTSPMTVWYQHSDVPVTQIKWCLLYFDDSKEGPAEAQIDPKHHSSDGSNFSARICEFFAS